MLAVLSNPTAQSETLSISRIRVDGGTQMRTGLNEQAIKEYVDAIIEGDKLPDLVVFYDGSEYWLADGFHRIDAYRRVHGAMYRLNVEVRAGTRRDAVLFAAGANAKHGLPRTPEDKQRAVDTLLRDEEWAQWSDREIARRCNVAHPLVAKRRKELSGSGYQMPTHRTVQRNGTTYMQDTSKIAAANQAREKPKPAVDPAQVAKEQRGGLTKREYAVKLMPDVITWLRTYKDRLNRTWREIKDVAAHSNSRHWFEITEEWTKREIYFEEDTLKAAIELAMIELQQEDETTQAAAPPAKAAIIYVGESTPPSTEDDLLALRTCLLAARPHIEKAEGITERLGHKLWMQQALHLINMELERVGRIEL